MSKFITGYVFSHLFYLLAIFGKLVLGCIDTDVRNHLLKIVEIYKMYLLISNLSENSTRCRQTCSRSCNLIFQMSLLIAKSCKQLTNVNTSEIQQDVWNITKIIPQMFTLSENLPRLSRASLPNTCFEIGRYSKNKNKLSKTHTLKWEPKYF